MTLTSFSRRGIGLFILAAALGLHSTPVLAQNATSSSSGMETVAAIVADVNLTDVKVAENNGTFTGTFSLQGGMGEQTDIVYGVVLSDTKGHLIEADKLGTLPALQSGEIKVIPFSYSIPSFVSGKTQVQLVALTSGGLPLGSAILANKSYPGTGATVICSQSKPQMNLISCKLSKAATVSVAVRKDSVLADTIGPSLSKNGAAGSTLSFDVSSLAINPGSYYVSVTTSSNESILFPLFIRGSFATFQNVIVSAAGTNTIKVTASYRAFPIKGLQIQYGLTDGSGTICGQGTETVNQVFFEKEIATSCTQGKISLSLMNASSTVLAALTRPFDTTLFQAGKDASGASTTTPSAPRGNSETLLLIGVIIIVLLGAFLIIRFFVEKKKSAGTITPLLLLCAIGFSLVGATTAHAYTVAASTMYQGEIYDWCAVGVSSDKSSYWPGDTMVLTGNIYAFYDAASSPDSIWSCGGYTNADLSGNPAYDSLQVLNFNGLVGKRPGNTPPLQPSITWFTSGQASLPIPSTMSPGNHFIAIRGAIVTSDYSCIGQMFCRQSQANVAPFNFSVVPHVNVHF